MNLRLALQNFHFTEIIIYVFFVNIIGVYVK